MYLGTYTYLIKTRGPTWSWKLGPLKCKSTLDDPQKFHPTHFFKLSNATLESTQFYASPTTHTHRIHTGNVAMPPRIPSQLAAQCCRAATEPSQQQASLAHLFAAFSIQTRNASILSKLSDNKGAHQRRIRVGRGASSGQGKTSGRGHNGQKQHGKIHPWFQGGQTPLIFQRGRLGFENLYVCDHTAPHVES